jgi:hypothetical protein
MIVDLCAEVSPALFAGLTYALRRSKTRIYDLVPGLSPALGACPVSFQETDLTEGDRSNAPGIPGPLLF